MTTDIEQLRPSRRTVLKTGAAASLAGLMPFQTIAQTGARFRRKNISNQSAQSDLVSYQRAVEKMLKLPPTDPRNWYRIAMIHLLDCPHGNWWFLCWHRGYLGWVERICRDLSGNPDFALPFWDWSALQRVPEEFFGNILDPTTSHYLEPDDFEEKFYAPVKQMWEAFSVPQRNQQKSRDNPDFETFWSRVRGNFVAKIDARGPTKTNPKFGPRARSNTRPSIIVDALHPRRFSGDFESAEAPDHYAGAQRSMLELQPHDEVHVDVSGFMGRFLSPVDPLFFLHHCNIDRLWDVWTRKQKRRNLPIGPDPKEVTRFHPERFLFFVDEAGAPAAEQTAADYFDIRHFDYDYEEGTGEKLIGLPFAQVAEVQLAAETEVRKPNFRHRQAAEAVLKPSSLFIQSLKTQDEATRFFIQITVLPSTLVAGQHFDVFLTQMGKVPNLDIDGPDYVGSHSIFGTPHHPVETLTFRLGATEAFRRLNERGVIVEGRALLVSVTTELPEAALAAEVQFEGTLQAVRIGLL